MSNADEKNRVRESPPAESSNDSASLEIVGDISDRLIAGSWLGGPITEAELPMARLALARLLTDTRAFERRSLEGQRRSEPARHVEDGPSAAGVMRGGSPNSSADLTPMGPGYSIASYEAYVADLQRLRTVVDAAMAMYNACPADHDATDRYEATVDAFIDALAATGLRLPKVLIQNVGPTADQVPLPRSSEEASVSHGAGGEGSSAPVVGTMSSPDGSDALDSAFSAGWVAAFDAFGGDGPGTPELALAKWAAALRAPPPPRCSICGSTRLVKDGRPDVCSLVNGKDGKGGCPDPLHDVDVEAGRRMAKVKT